MGFLCNSRLFVRLSLLFSSSQPVSQSSVVTWPFYLKFIEMSPSQQSAPCCSGDTSGDHRRHTPSSDCLIAQVYPELEIREAADDQVTTRIARNSAILAASAVHGDYSVCFFSLPCHTFIRKFPKIPKNFIILDYIFKKGDERVESRVRRCEPPSQTEGRN